MNNLYTPSKLLSEEKFKEIENIFRQVWNIDTTFFSVQKKWTEKNKALGQCAVTSMVIQDLLGGKIIYDKHNIHIWNELPDGTWQDFSREQFKKDLCFTITRYQTKDEITGNKTGINNKTEEKYLILKNRFDKLYKLTND